LPAPDPEPAPALDPAPAPSEASSHSSTPTMLAHEEAASRNATTAQRGALIGTPSKDITDADLEAAALRLRDCPRRRYPGPAWGGRAGSSARSTKSRRIVSTLADAPSAGRT